MNANVLAAHLADSGLVLVGNAVHEDWLDPAVAPLQFVAAEDEDYFSGDPGCQCCCCTGECRSDYDDDYEYETREEFEAAGFYLEQEMDVVVNAWHRVKYWVDGSASE